MGTEVTWGHECIFLSAALTYVHEESLKQGAGGGGVWAGGSGVGQGIGETLGG